MFLLLFFWILVFDILSAILSLYTAIFIYIPVWDYRWDTSVWIHDRGGPGVRSQSTGGFRLVSCRNGELKLCIIHQDGLTWKTTPFGLFGFGEISPLLKPVTSIFKSTPSRFNYIRQKFTIIKIMQDAMPIFVYLDGEEETLELDYWGNSELFINLHIDEYWLCNKELKLSL